MGPQNFPLNGYQISFLGVKWPGRDTNHSPPSRECSLLCPSHTTTCHGQGNFISNSFCWTHFMKTNLHDWYNIYFFRRYASLATWRYEKCCSESQTINGHNLHQTRAILFEGWYLRWFFMPSTGNVAYLLASNCPVLVGLETANCRIQYEFKVACQCFTCPVYRHFTLEKFGKRFLTR